MSDVRPQLARAQQLLQQGRLDEAEAVVRHVLEGAKRNAEAHAVLATVMNLRGGFRDATRLLERAVKLDPKEPLHLCRLGLTLVARDDLDGALAAYDKALALDRLHPLAVVGKAEVLERRGRHEAALKLIDRFAAKGEPTPRMRLVEARVASSRGEWERAVDTAESALAANMPGAVRRGLLFALGQALDRLGRHDEAFARFVDANAADAVPFDAARMRQQFDAIRRVYSQEAWPDLAASSSTSERPVFIVGLPRGGSTLIEQIIHAHPSAFGAGEIPVAADMLRSFAERCGGFPGGAAAATAEQLDEIASEYDEALRRRSPDALRVVDKTLENVQRLGLLHRLFPNACIIHVTRDPMDHGLSCFINDLMPTLHPWAGSLEGIGTFHRLTGQLVAHWRDLGIPIIEIAYEAVVDDLEGEARRIIDAVGLPWNDRCLAFHEAGRDVATLSYDQVRRPIYRTAVERWRRFDSHLEPLRLALGS